MTPKCVCQATSVHQVWWSIPKHGKSVALFICLTKSVREYVAIVRSRTVLDYPGSSTEGTYLKFHVSQ